jgi:hypothetical protein
MLLNDVVKLIPKSWLAKEHIAHVNVVSCASLETLDTIHPVVCLPAVYQLLIIQSQQILQKR